MNKLRRTDAVSGMMALEDAIIPITVTSPPFDGVRCFGRRWDFSVFKAIADELWRVTCQGGVVCWNVQDQIVNGGQTGTSFRQALYFQRRGFRLHNEIIIEKGFALGLNRKRYGVAPEHVFVFSKGDPRAFHPIEDRENKYAGVLFRYSARDKWGHIHKRRGVRIRPHGMRRNVWRYTTGLYHTTRDRYAFGHTALMPEMLAHDLIVSWSDPLDLVLDPMAGAGTTCKMALLADRYYLGFEPKPKFFGIAQKRMADAHAEYRRSLAKRLA